MTPIRILAFASLTVIATVGAAAAAQPMRIALNDHIFMANPAVMGAPVSWGSYYGHSGSIGRLDFGASVHHPEGPGNFSD
jgi:hypothetical protein